MLAVGSTGATIDPFIFQNVEAPKHPSSFAASLAVGMSGIFASLLLGRLHWRANTKKAEMTEEEVRQK